MSFLTDLQFASRTLRAKPVFTAIAVASLALGIGANTAIFSVVESALLRELPYDHADRLLLVRESQSLTSSASLAPGEYLDYQQQAHTLSGLAGYTSQSITLTGNGDPQKLTAVSVTPNFFEVLGAHARIGRLFTAAQDKPGNVRAAVISESTWRGIFASDSNILSRDILLNGAPFHVVGVLRQNEEYPSKEQIWITSRFAVPEYVENLRESSSNLSVTYGGHWINGLGLLRPGVTITDARADLRIIAAHDKSFRRGHIPRIAALHESLVGNIKPALWLLLGAVMALLLTACANMSGLLLSRSVARVRELSLRAALGATRWRIVRLLLSESLLLAFAGGALGIILADLGQSLLTKYSPYDLPGALHPKMGWPVLAFCVAAILLSGFISGLIPALRASQVDVQEGLKESARESASGTANNWRRLLVSAEIALSVMLLCSASLLIRSFVNILEVNPGFDSANAVTARISLPLTAYSHADINAFWEKLLAKISELPGVESAAIETTLPLSGGESGSDVRVRSLTGHMNFVAVSPGLFQTLRIPLLSGRTFDGNETEKSPSVAVVSRSFAEKLFPGQSAVGQKFNGGPIPDPVTVIGVAADVKSRGLNEPAPLMVYFSAAQDSADSASLIVKTIHSGDIAGELRSTLHSLDRALPLTDIKPLSVYLDGSLEARRFILSLLTVFAALAILLAAIGLYGVLAFSIEQRTREIGIRIALGAARAEVLRLVLSESCWVVLCGLTAGLAGALFTSSFLKQMLFGITPFDYTAYSVAAILVLVIAAVASSLPTLRATRVDPVTALRYE